MTLLKENGIEAKNLKGGILAWIDKVDPTLGEVLSAARCWRLAVTRVASHRARMSNREPLSCDR